MTPGLTPQVQHLARRTAVPPGAQPDLPARSAHASVVVEAPSLVYDAASGALVLAYLPLPDDLDTDALVAALRRLPFRRNERTNKLVTQSLTFGSYPRSLHQAACGTAGLATTDPDAHSLLVGLAPVLARLYQQTNPALYDRHVQLARGIRQEWLLPGSPFSSGIVNRDSPLSYHRDSGNLPGTWSVMLGLRREVAGGRLILPEYDAALAIADRSLTLFDGKGLLHGVAPFAKQAPDGYRFTCVWFTLAGMRHCEGRSAEADKWAAWQRAHRANRG